MSSQVTRASTWPRHCEERSDEAIHLFGQNPGRKIVCFVAARLAMTSGWVNVQVTWTYGAAAGPATKSGHCPAPVNLSRTSSGTAPPFILRTQTGAPAAWGTR